MMGASSLVWKRWTTDNVTLETGDTNKEHPDIEVYLVNFCKVPGLSYLTMKEARNPS